jgi:hypothetical protein
MLEIKHAKNKFSCEWHYPWFQPDFQPSYCHVITKHSSTDIYEHCLHIITRQMKYQRAKEVESGVVKYGRATGSSRVFLAFGANG